MKPTILILTLLLLTVACTPQPPECTPVVQEVIKEVEVIREVEVIKEVEVIREINTSVYNKTCENKLMFCHIRVDEINDQLYDCMVGNTSVYVDNLSTEHARCKRDLSALENKTKELWGLVR